MIIEKLTAELKKVNTNANGIAVATDIVNHLQATSDMSDTEIIKLVANMFVNKNKSAIIKYHDAAIEWNKFLGKKYK